MWFVMFFYVFPMLLLAVFNSNKLYKDYLSDKNRLDDEDPKMTLYSVAVTILATVVPIINISVLIYFWDDVKKFLSIPLVKTANKYV